MGEFFSWSSLRHKRSHKFCPTVVKWDWLFFCLLTLIAGKYRNPSNAEWSRGESRLVVAFLTAEFGLRSTNFPLNAKSSKLLTITVWITNYTIMINWWFTDKLLQTHIDDIYFVLFFVISMHCVANDGCSKKETICSDSFVKTILRLFGCVCVSLFVLIRFLTVIQWERRVLDNWYTNSNLIYCTHMTEWIWVSFLRVPFLFWFVKIENAVQNGNSLVPSEISACKNGKAISSYWLNFVCVDG